MNITITLFQIDFDCFSALAVDVDHQSNVWTATYDSRGALILHLDRTGVVTQAEIEELRRPSTFEHGGQILHASLSLADIEKAGFTRYSP